MNGAALAFKAVHSTGEVAIAGGVRVDTVVSDTVENVAVVDVVAVVGADEEVGCGTKGVVGD